MYILSSNKDYKGDFYFDRGVRNLKYSIIIGIVSLFLIFIVMFAVGTQYNRLTD